MVTLGRPVRPYSTICFDEHRDGLASLAYMVVSANLGSRRRGGQVGVALGWARVGIRWSRREVDQVGEEMVKAAG